MEMKVVTYMHKFPKVQSKLLYKYIFSYTLMFFIPLVTMSVIIYLNSVGSLREGIEQSNLDKLNQVKNITDERMKELGKLAARISYDSRLTPFMVSDGFNGKEAIDELNKYKANSSIINDLILNYRGDDHVYSSEGSYSLKTFENKYHLSESNMGSITQLLQNDLPVIFPAKPVKVNNAEEERLLIYTYPIKRNLERPYGSVTYLIEESAITGLIKNALGDFQGDAFIFDHEHHILTSSLHSETISKAEMKKLGKIKDGVTSLKINSEEYSVLSVKSELSGWTFITVMPTDQFFQKVVSLQRLLVMILVSIIISGMGFAVILARKQYLPIHNLLDYIKTNRMSDDEDMNELETIKVTIDKVFKDHASLSMKINSQAPYVRYQYLTRILNGKLADEKEINRLLDSNDIPMKKAGYFVAVVSLKDLSMQKQEEMIQFLGELSLPDAICYGVEVGFKEAIALIVSVDKRAPEDMQDIVENLKVYMEAQLGLEPILAVGNICTEKSKINRSFIEALAVLEYRILHGDKSITLFEEISPSQDQTIGYPKDEQIKLAQSLKQGDQIVALETVSHMFTGMIKADISVYMVRCICFDIINTVLKAANEAGLDDSHYHIHEIVEFHSIEELERSLEPVILAICSEVERKNETTSNKLGNEIIEYIQKSFTNYGLSLEGTAQLFKLSTSYLSRFFKEQTGVTFTQYVWNLRFAEVKRKLAETDETIRDIVLTAGYMDVANFTRKFRKAEGVTPGQYRALHDQQNHSNIKG